jgi:hypothetical protein
VRLRPAGAVAQEAGGRLRPAMARSLRGTTGWGLAKCSRSWPGAKPSTKMLNANEKHKFLCSVVSRVV